MSGAVVGKALARLAGAGGRATWALMGRTGEPAPLVALWRVLWAVECLADIPTVERARLQAQREAWVKEWPDLRNYTRDYFRAAREGDESFDNPNGAIWPAEDRLRDIAAFVWACSKPAFFGVVPMPSGSCNRTTAEQHAEIFRRAGRDCL